MVFLNQEMEKEALKGIAVQFYVCLFISLFFS